MCLRILLCVLVPGSGGWLGWFYSGLDIFKIFITAVDILHEKLVRTE